MKSLLRSSASSHVQAVAPIPAAARAMEKEGLQVTPLLVEADGREARLMVDHVHQVGDRVLVAGWRTGPVRLSLSCGGVALEAREHVFARPDVSRHFALADDVQAGFALVVGPCAGAGLSLHWSFGDGGADGSQPLVVELPSGGVGSQALGPLESLLAYEQAPYTAEWKRLVDGLPRVDGDCACARAHIESASVFRGTDAFLLVGWVAATPGTLVWVEDERGNCHPVETGFRSNRADVHQAFGAELGIAALRSGLLLGARSADGKPVHVLSVKALTPAGVHLLAEAGVTPHAGDAVSAARMLFGIGALNDEWPARVERVDLPVLSTMIEQAQREWHSLPVLVRDCGRLPAKPVASVVVPLYGRFDFVEGQMLEWARDPWIREHAELVYVVDDPDLVEPFRAHAEELHRLYGVPFRWVWGGVNRGFSGANNLGAMHAASEYLLFLNSDVFPQRPGWLQAMVETLRTRPRVGAVAPRLVFAEGGIQHAGMRFERLEEYGVWINQHPNMGLDPVLDPHQAPASVPAATGACLMLRRRDFNAVGGWDTGYLVGDFEDSDLCMKLREAGMDILYLPGLQLTHLERQSIAALGDGSFRTRVTLWNAVRHQARWRSLIERSMRAVAA